MANALGVETLRDTKLWKRLNDGWPEEPAASVAKFLAANLLPLTEEAANRMKSFPTLHSQYTLHDDTHLLRVSQLMGGIIPEEVLKSVLNPVEIALLILAAFFHDQGMVLEAAELAALDSNADFKVFRDNWAIDHPNLGDVRRRVADTRLSKAERDSCIHRIHELEAAMLTDWVRQTHGERSERFVTEHYGKDKRLDVCGINLANVLGKLCRSHVLEGRAITPAHGFAYDEDIATFPVNVVYLAVVLRLADILDFDRERTPDELYRTIHFSSPVSLEEWAKHRSITGWRIQPDQVRFTADCDRPEYERGVRRFMDWIDIELQSAKSALRQFPKKAERYVLQLPEKADRDRIRPKSDAYIYHDLEFTVSRDEIVKLLMGVELYGSPSLCIRELLQNSLDALRHRKAILKRDDRADWNDGLVELEHSVDAQGREVLRCRDNGVGMDEYIIQKFLVRAGRSYYRSPEFERQRATFSGAGADFDPCSRFGIGFMSCFMVGDQIAICTRRYGGGKPLVVEINGLNGLVVFRQGLDNQPVGTTVEITGRSKPAFFDDWADKVRLIETINAYAIACEFPIIARCHIPEIKDEIKIPPGVFQSEHAFQTLGLKSIATFEQSFTEVDTRLRGSIRTSFITDDKAQLTLKSSEGAWSQPSTAGDSTNFQLADGKRISVSGFYRTKTCLDGILVCGAQGRQMSERVIVGTSYPNAINLGNDFFVLDVRGDIKPSLTPARSPSKRNRMDDGHPTWERLQVLADRAHGSLWAKVLESYPKEQSAKVIWQLALLYNFNFTKIRADKLWNLLWIPAVNPDGSLLWRKFSEIPPIRFDKDADEPFAREADGKAIGGDAELKQWHHHNQADSPLIDGLLKSTVLGMATANILGNRLYLEFRPPSDGSLYPKERFWANIYTGARIAVEFDKKTLSKVLYAGGARPLFNVTHPVTQLIWETKYKTELSELEWFFYTLASALCRKEVLRLITKTDDKGPVDARALKMLGHMFAAIDWTQMPAELRPPYLLWMDGQGLIELTPDVFLQWKNLC